MMEGREATRPPGDPTAAEARSPRSSLDSTNGFVQDDDETPREAPFSEKGNSLKERFALSHLAIPLALLVGGAITGGTTYALVARVQHLIANATVDGDASKWAQSARTTAYDACYDGCNDCDEPSYAYNACQLTARANVKGVICAGDDMWNWAAADRYPQACLAAVGQLLMGEELERVKQSYRNQLAIIILTVLGGVVGGVLTFFLWRRLTTTKAQREAAKAKKASKTKPDQRKWSFRRPATWKKQTHHDKPADKERSPSRHSRSRSRSRRSRSSSSSSSSSSNSSASRRRSSAASSRRSSNHPRLSSLTAASLTALSASTSHVAQAYPCTGRSPAWNQFFASPNGTVAGVVHGWLADCSSRQVCDTRCTTSCSTTNGHRTCSKSCSDTNCRTVVSVVRTPQQYVGAIAPHVIGCGFDMVDAPAAADGFTARVGNARLEMDWWVRVSVNGLNVTRKDQTDEMVLCLHGLGGV